MLRRVVKRREHEESTGLVPFAVGIDGAALLDLIYSPLENSEAEAGNLDIVDGAKLLAKIVKPFTLNIKSGSALVRR